MLKPLIDREIESLNGILSQRLHSNTHSVYRDAGVLNLYELDGLFTAIVSGPRLITPAQWFPGIWGECEPVWGEENDFEEVLSLMTRHMNNIAAKLNKTPRLFAAGLIERICNDTSYCVAETWCRGYIRALRLAGLRWPLEDDYLQLLLVPIKAFASKKISRNFTSFSRAEIKNIQNALGQNVIDIHAYLAVNIEQ